MKLLNIDAKGVNVVDAATGEVTELGTKHKLMLYTPRQNKRGADFVCAYQQALQDLALLKISGGMFRVLMFLLGSMDFENWCRVTQDAVAEAIGMDCGTVSHIFRKLIKAGLLMEHYNRYNFRSYRVAPLLAWKGSVNSLQRLVQECSGLNQEGLIDENPID